MLIVKGQCKDWSLFKTISFGILIALLLVTLSTTMLWIGFKIVDSLI